MAEIFGRVGVGWRLALHDSWLLAYGFRLTGVGKLFVVGLCGAVGGRGINPGSRLLVGFVGTAPWTLSARLAWLRLFSCRCRRVRWRNPPVRDADVSQRRDAAQRLIKLLCEEPPGARKFSYFLHGGSATLVQGVRSQSSAAPAGWSSFSEHCRPLGRARTLTRRPQFSGLSGFSGEQP